MSNFFVRLKRWLMPLVMLATYITGPAILIWQYVNFSWIAVGLALVNLIFPAYSAYIAIKQKLETPALLNNMLITLLVSTVGLSFAALEQLMSLMFPIALTWCHILLVYYLTKVLPKLELRHTGLETGNLFPGFVFEDAQGNPITRRKISDGPILFYFFRGNWCPFCSVQIATLMTQYKQIQSEGIHLAFVSTQPHLETQKLAEQYGLECDYLVDVDFKFSTQYQLLHKYAVPPALGKYGTDTLLPTLILIDHSDKVMMMERTDNARVRPDPDVILDRIKKLGKNAWLENIVNERTKELNDEKQKSEKIILNILPEHTAIELKETGKTEARFYQNATLLFADFAGFTRIATGVEPQILVDSLNAYFEQYDALVDELGLEKIKTIGDAYMVASGLPIRDPEHATKCCTLALKMLEVGEKLKAKHAKSGLCVFESRIGIHSGPVMAGVVGKKKFCYDIWGDTVNLASRMESNSEQGRINISASTFQLLKGAADVEVRGTIEVKNHTPQMMYFLNGLT